MIILLYSNGLYVNTFLSNKNIRGFAAERPTCNQHSIIELSYDYWSFLSENSFILVIVFIKIVHIFIIFKYYSKAQRIKKSSLNCRNY